MTNVIYIPTKEELEFIDRVCKKVIDDMSVLNTDQKAYALVHLMDGFQLASGYRLFPIYDKKNGDGKHGN